MHTRKLTATTLASALASSILLAAVTMTGALAPVAAHAAPEADDADTGVDDVRPVVTEQLLADTYARLQKLNHSGVTLNGYQLAKALAFLEEARREFYLRNRSGVVFDFVESAQIIAEALEQGVSIGTGNRRHASSETILPGLWQRVGRLKAGATFACVGDKVAQAEVLLIAAGNDQKLLGWRATQARARMAEAQLDLAEAVTSC